MGPRGNPVGTPWEACGKPVGTLWEPPWEPCGKPVGTSWEARGNPVGTRTPWEPLETPWEQSEPPAKTCGNPVRTFGNPWEPPWEPMWKPLCEPCRNPFGNPVKNLWKPCVVKEQSSENQEPNGTEYVPNRPWSQENLTNMAMEAPNSRHEMVFVLVRTCPWLKRKLDEEDGPVHRTVSHGSTKQQILTVSGGFLESFCEMWCTKYTCTKPSN